MIQHREGTARGGYLSQSRPWLVTCPTLLTGLLVAGGFTASWQVDYHLDERRLHVTHDTSCRAVIGTVNRYMSVTNHALAFAASEDI
jgi:hypothetical protein